MEINEITGDILDASVKIHKMFGPGLLESVYERLLTIELGRRGHHVERQKSVSFRYEDVLFENAFRIDLLVDGQVVVELKSTTTMHPVYAKQVRTYLVLAGLQVGLLVNFGMPTLKDGFVRVINSKTDFCDSASLRDANSQPSHLCDSASLRDAKSVVTGVSVTLRDVDFTKGIDQI